MSNTHEQTCCFTGHRKLPTSELYAIEAQAEKQIRKLYANGVRVFRVGGAMGFDTMMAQLLFRLRETDMPDIKVVLMYPFDGFTDGWTVAEKALYAELLPKYDEVHRVAERGGSGAYLERDKALVNGSAYCIAYCRNTKARSGTAFTVRYANSKAININNLFLNKKSR